MQLANGAGEPNSPGAVTQDFSTQFWFWPFQVPVYGPQVYPVRAGRPGAKACGRHSSVQTAPPGFETVWSTQSSDHCELFGIFFGSVCAAHGTRRRRRPKPPNSFMLRLCV